MFQGFFLPKISPQYKQKYIRSTYKVIQNNKEKQYLRARSNTNNTVQYLDIIEELNKTIDNTDTIQVQYPHLRTILHNIAQY